MENEIVVILTLFYFVQNSDSYQQRFLPAGTECSIKLVSSIEVNRNYNTIGFEQPNLDYATAEAEKTLRLWTWTPSPRIIAVLMAFHGRLGALSSMRCIAHDVGIVKLCVGGEKRD